MIALSRCAARPRVTARRLNYPCTLAVGAVLLAAGVIGCGDEDTGGSVPFTFQDADASDAPPDGNDAGFEQNSDAAAVEISPTDVVLEVSNEAASNGG